MVCDSWGDTKTFVVETTKQIPEVVQKGALLTGDKYVDEKGLNWFESKTVGSGSQGGFSHICAGYRWTSDENTTRLKFTINDKVHYVAGAKAWSDTAGTQLIAETLVTDIFAHQMELAVSLAFTSVSGSFLFSYLF